MYRLMYILSLFELNEKEHKIMEVRVTYQEKLTENICTDQNINNIKYYLYTKQVHKAHKSMKNLRMYRATQKHMIF